MLKRIITVLLCVLMYMPCVTAYHQGAPMFFTDFDDAVNNDIISFDEKKWKISADADNNNRIINLNTGGMSSYLRIGEKEWSNYAVRFRVRNRSVKSGGAMHINFYESDNQNNCYRLILYDNCNVAVRPVKNGTYGDNVLIMTSIDNFLNDWTTFEIRVAKSRIELYINELFAGGISSSEYNGGSVSFSFWDMQGEIDDISVSSVEGMISVEKVTSAPVLYMKTGDVLPMEYTIYPENATNKSVKFISSDTDKLTITHDGRLRAIAPGTVTARVRTDDGNKEAKTQITITEGVGNGISYSRLEFINDTNAIYFGLCKPENFKLFENGESIEFYVETEKYGSNIAIEASLTDSLTNSTQTMKIIPLSGKRTYSFSPTRYSVYNLAFKVLENGREIYSESVDAAVCIRAERPADKSIYFGVQPQINFAFTRTNGWDFNYNGMEKYETLNLCMEQIKWLGANLVRSDIGVLSSEEEAESGKFDFTYPDALIKATYEAGIDLDLINNNKGAEVLYPYSEKAYSWNSVPKTPESMESFQRLLLQRYKSYNNYFYEIGNEINHSSYFTGTPEEYGDILRVVTGVCEDSGVKTSAGSVVANGSGADDALFYNQIASCGEADYFAYHSHGDLQTLIENHKTVDGLMKNAGIKKEILLNETGISTADKQKQAEIMMKKLLWAYGNGHRGAVLFTLRQYGEIAMPGGMGGYAMVSHTGDIRPSFVAYANLIDKLNKTIRAVNCSEDEIHAFLFEKDGGDVISVFDESENPVRKIVVNSAHTAIDMYGNELVKSTEYKIGNTPIYIVFHGETNFDIIPEEMGVIIIAIYDENGKMLQIETDNVYENNALQTSVKAIEAVESGCVVKVFYMDKLSCLSPIFTAIELEQRW